MTKKPVKRTQKQKQKQRQTQRVVVNIDNSRKTVRRQTNGQQQSSQSRGPQIIPIPYPIMQPQLNTPAQPGFARPSVAIPNQTFETNFKNINDQINNLSERFNTYGKAFMDKISEAKPTPPPAPAPEPSPQGNDFTMYMDLPDTPPATKPAPTTESKAPSVRVPNQTPIVRGVKDLIDRGGTVYRDGEPSTNFKIDENDNVIPLANPKTLFRSPTLNMNPNQFNKPKVLTYNSDVFNRPTLAFNPPAEEFAKEEEKADEEAVDEAVIKPKPLTKKQIEERRKRSINDEVRTLEDSLKEVQDGIKDNPNNTKLIRQENELFDKIIQKELDKYGIDLDDYDEIVEKLKRGETLTKDNKKKLNALLSASSVIKDSSVLGNIKDPAKILSRLENSAVGLIVKRRQRQLKPPVETKPSEPKKPNITFLRDLTQNTEGVMSNPKTYEI